MKHQPVLVKIDGENHVLPVGGEVCDMFIYHIIYRYYKKAILLLGIV